MSVSDQIKFKAKSTERDSDESFYIDKNWNLPRIVKTLERPE